MINDITVELRVRGMGQEMISAIGVETMHIADRMQEGVRKAIANFDFDKYIEAQAEQALLEYVQSPEGKKQLNQIYRALIKERLQQFPGDKRKFMPGDRVSDSHGNLGYYICNGGTLPGEHRTIIVNFDDNGQDYSGLFAVEEDDMQVVVS